MLYREAGQLSTSYAMERRTFRLRQDRVGLWLLLGFAFIAVPWLGNDYWFSAILLPLNLDRESVDATGRWTPEMLAAIHEHYKLAFRDTIFTYVPR